ncbi:MAG: bifunctional folylpolyglutamate synthase/dihydrofolate synthase [Firmicutes bacterium]|nr:bifunctional folylpolyglutamate synthase/dihydrofolate synthase [Bacillota bacterium]
MITYREAEEYISDIPKFAGKNTLQDTRKMLGLLTESPRSKIIHVAGTNGKGSVCAYLRAILMAGGCSVGMFISPHLETTRERICLGTELISEEAFVRIFERVREASVSAQKNGLNHPSYFEFLFLMAMCYFCEKNPEYIILETGLGGRLDATNCILPDLCVITEIGYDHMQYLGNTIEEIAYQKAGIIKPGIPVVFVDKSKAATKVLEEYAKETKSPVVMVRKEDILNVNIKNKSIDFSLHTGYYNYVGLSLNTTALYQTENASLAVCASEMLGDERITPDIVRKGLGAARWPGRMEEILPGIYLDGAHNEDGIAAFLSTVQSTLCKGRRFLLFGVVQDKRYDVMIRNIADKMLFDEVAVTVLETERSASMEQLKEAWGKYGQINCSFYENVEKAYLHLCAEKESCDEIYVVGSLYLIGQMKSLMRRIQND